MLVSPIVALSASIEIVHSGDLSAKGALALTVALEEADLAS
jgi:hypothetical protein